VSLTTIYNRFGTREALIRRAVRQWMETYTLVPLPEPDPKLSAYDNIRPITRTMLEPWRQNPMMLRSFVRAALGPGGEEVRQVGADWVAPGPRRRSRRTSSRSRDRVVSAPAHAKSRRGVGR